MGEDAISIEILITLGILTTTIFLFLFEIVRVDIVAVIVLVALGITKVIPENLLFSGFSSEAVISLISVMIISKGLENSGIVHSIAHKVIKMGKESTYKTWFFLMISSGMLASFMRSLGTVALYIPIVNKVIHRTSFTKTELLLPIAFCSIAGSTLTMVGSGPLIILNSLLNNTDIGPSEAKLDEFSLFYVFPIGLTSLVFCILYLFFFGRKLLPEKKHKGIKSPITYEYFNKTYGKGHEIFELKVPAECKLMNLSLKDVELNLDKSCSIIAYKQKSLDFPPLRGTYLELNSNIAIMGDKEKIVEFANKYNFKLKNKLSVFSDLLHVSRTGLAEVVIPPSSSLIGVKVNEIHMKRKHNVQALSMYRNDSIYFGEELKEIFLRAGDTLSIYTSWEALEQFQKNPDFAVITTNYPKDTKPKFHKMPNAIFFTLISIVLIIFGNFSLPIGLLLGAVGMISTGVINIDDAYDAVSWKTVFLLGGLIPLGIAMETTGTAEWIVSHTGIANGAIPVIYKQIGLSIISTFLALIISNIGATVVLVPIGISLAEQAGANPSLFALTIALSASNAFLLPTHQSTSIISGQGGYKVKDFIKIGSVITIANWFIIILFLKN